MTNDELNVCHSERSNVPAGREESRGETQWKLHGILRLRFAPLRMTSPQLLVMRHSFVIWHSWFSSGVLLQFGEKNVDPAPHFFPPGETFPMRANRSNQLIAFVDRRNEICAIVAHAVCQ